jgi:hypothetical protein
VSTRNETGVTDGQRQWLIGIDDDKAIVPTANALGYFRKA